MSLLPAYMPLKGRPHGELVELAKQHQWVHAIDLKHGFTTPGAWSTGNSHIREAIGETPFYGKKVLDIGCWDGMYRFLAEDLGAAEVYSTDLVSQRDFSGSPTYQIAHAALGSRAKYYPNLSVYNVEQLGIRDFDVVLFTGIYYHLKDPVLALTRLRRVMKDGALIVIEGAVLEEEGCFARFYYRSPYFGDQSNWWVPTVQCLKEWVECSFLKIQTERRPAPEHSNPRCTLLAKAVRGSDPLYWRPPEGLEEYSV
jgi:tRNA (mo5U34)-methyltransferase